MTKILYIVTQPEFGGAQRYIFDLARLRQGYGGQATNLDKSQYEVHIAAGLSAEVSLRGGVPADAAIPSPSDTLFDRARAQNLAVHGLKHLVRPISPIHDFLAYFELKKLIAEIKPDIVHLNSSKAGVLGSLAAKRIGIQKIIYTAHGFVFNEPMNPIKRWLYKKAERGTAKRADAVIAVSEHDRKTGIAAGIPENKIVTIHNGIDPAQMYFLSREEARVSLRARRIGGRSNLNSAPGHGSADSSHNATLGLPRSSPFAKATGDFPRNDKMIGCIANFYPTKALDVLIDAMTNVDAQLVIIGDGELRGQLEKQIKKLNLTDRIRLVGQRPDAHQYLKAFDLFVLPSRKEGFPYVLLEAAVAGVPMVATRVGGVSEIIHDGVTGCIAEPNNPDELAQKISQALGHPLVPRLPADCTLAAMLEKTRHVYEN